MGWTASIQSHRRRRSTVRWWTAQSHGGQQRLFL